MKLYSYNITQEYCSHDLEINNSKYESIAAHNIE